MYWPISDKVVNIESLEETFLPNLIALLITIILKI